MWNENHTDQVTLSSSPTLAIPIHTNTNTLMKMTKSYNKGSLSKHFYWIAGIFSEIHAHRESPLMLRQTRPNISISCPQTLCEIINRLMLATEVICISTSLSLKETDSQSETGGLKPYMYIYKSTLFVAKWLFCTLLVRHVLSRDAFGKYDGISVHAAQRRSSINNS